MITNTKVLADVVFDTCEEEYNNTEKVVENISNVLGACHMLTVKNQYLIIVKVLKVNKSIAIEF